MYASFHYNCVHDSTMCMLALCVCVCVCVHACVNACMWVCVCVCVCVRYPWIILTGAQCQVGRWCGLERWRVLGAWSIPPSCLSAFSWCQPWYTGNWEHKPPPPLPLPSSAPLPRTTNISPVVEYSSFGSSCSVDYCSSGKPQDLFTVRLFHIVYCWLQVILRVHVHCWH